MPLAKYTKSTDYLDRTQFTTFKVWFKTGGYTSHPTYEEAKAVYEEFGARLDKIVTTIMEP